MARSQRLKKKKPKQRKPNLSLLYLCLLEYELASNVFSRRIALRVNKLSYKHVYIPTCVGNLFVVPVTLGHPNMCWHFVFKFGWFLAIGQKFLPPLIHPNFSLVSSC